MSSPQSFVPRYCPRCGARVSHAAADCFLCGYRFDERKRRWRIPVADLALLMGIAAVLFTWWRWDADRRVLALTPTPSPTPSPTATLTPTPTPIPSPTATPTLTPTPAPITHTVESGDTLYGIAGIYDITLEQLLAANNLSADAVLRIGQVLLIPPTPPPAPLSAANGSTFQNERGGIINYSVKPGDTVARIAAIHDVKIATILSHNDIADPNNLIPGTVLVIVKEDKLSAARLVPTPVFPAPLPLAPADGSEIADAAGPVLRWVSVGLLPEDAAYKVHLAYADPALPILDPILTRATSLALDPAWRPPDEANSAEILWWVSVVRRQSNGELFPLSPPGPVRRFSWH
ncbi:MAG: LysM peptidoglycan-binding domain-containing protein [Caldilineales bacterium]|nr:LysM peptidoglycan-binding domain-containing protein [Caldilineales bacterium]